MEEKKDETIISQNYKYGYSYAYEAELRGVDGSGDIAILCINTQTLSNVTTPCIEKKCHPYLCFGKSCKETCGDVVYGLGNPDGRGRFGPQGIVAGDIINVNYADDTGYAQPDLFVASFPVFWNSTGLPILNKHGHVVGMQTMAEMGQYFGATGTTAASILPTRDQANNIVAGPAQHFMKRVIYTLVQGNCGKNRSQVVNVTDSGVPPYLSYRKGFLGLAWQVLTGMDFFTTTIADPTTPTLPQQSMVLLNNAFTAGPCCKHVVGVRVLALAGGTTYTYISEPGGASAGVFPTLPVSPLIPYVGQDDIITHIDGTPLGNDGVHGKTPCCTSAPARKLWTKIAGCNVSVTYRKYSDNYKNTYTASVAVQDVPALYDYPWYVIGNFPRLTTTGLVPPAPNFQLPSDIFHPAV